jgi:hypothetical protein
MSTKRAELLFRFKMENQAQLDALVGALRNVKVEVAGAGAEAAKASSEFDKAGAASGRMAEGMTGAIVKGTMLADVLQRGLEFIKEYSIGAAQYAARTETLAVVMDKLAKVNNLSVGAVRATAKEIQGLGITTQESMAVINKMIFAQLDLKKATDLARLAQNAAVIAGINSSDALAGIVHGITTRQTEVLRTYGITVTFEEEFTKASRALGRELSAQEKTQIALNKVLQEGVKIQGVYEASMLTTGKQITSLARYTDEMKNAIGEGLVPVLGRAVLLLTDFAKWAGESGDSLSRLTTLAISGGAGIGGMALAGRVLPMTGPWGRAAGFALGAGAAYMGLDQDPEELAVEFSRRGVAGLVTRRALLSRQYAGATGEKRASIANEMLGIAQSLEAVKDQSAATLAQLYIRQNKGVMFGAEKATRDIDLGGGVILRRGTVLQAINDLKGGDTSGATLNEEAMRKAIGEAEAGDAAREARRALEAATKSAAGRAKTLIETLTLSTLSEVQKYEFEIAKVEREIMPNLSGGDQRQIRALMGRRLAEVADKQRGDFDKAAMPGLGNRMASLFNAYQPQVSAMPTGMPALPGFATIDFEATGDAGKADLDRRVSSMQRMVTYQERMIQLTAGPGGELDAINRVASARIAAAYREFELTKDRGRLEAALDESRYGRMEALAQLQQQQLRQYQETSRGVYRAMIAGGGSGGLGSFVKAQGNVLGEQLFVNASTGMFQKFGSTLGGIGEKSGLGKLLDGTIFDPKNKQLEMATASNTMATHQNTMALTRLSGVLGLGGGGGGMLPGNLVSDVLGGGLFAPIGGVGEIDLFGGGTVAAHFAKQPSGLMRGIGIAGAAAAGTMGTIAGIQQGGWKGAMTAGGSLAGAAGSIMAMSGLAGPAAPILMGVGLAMGMLPALLGDPRKKFDEKVSNSLEANRFSGATATDYTVDVSGAALDYNFRGRMRAGATVINNWNVQAIDSKSFLDHKGAIGEVIRQQLQEDGPLRSEIADVARYA